MTHILYLIPIVLGMLGGWFMTMASGVRRSSRPGYTLETLAILSTIAAFGLFGVFLVFLP